MQYENRFFKTKEAAEKEAKRIVRYCLKENKDFSIVYRKTCIDVQVLFKLVSLYFA